MSVANDAPIGTVNNAVTAYALANAGQLPGVTKLGPRFVVRTAVRCRWVDGQLDTQ